MNSQIKTKPEFDDVLNEYYRYILKFVSKQVNNIEDAKDLTQEIFLKAYNNYKKYDDRKAVIKTWLFTIANNHIINYWKSSYITRKYNFDYDFTRLPSYDNILEQVIQEEDVRIILSVMNSVLKKRNIHIMNLYFFSELSPKEISELMDMNQKTVSNVISLSIKKIKDKLEDKNE